VAEGAGGLRAGEALGELGPRLEGLELRLGEWVVARDVRAAVPAGDAEIGSGARAMAFEVIDDPRSAWTVSWPGRMACVSQVAAIGRSATGARSAWVTIQPTT